MACDAQDFHVPFLRLDALRRSDGDDRAVFMLHTVSDFSVREQIQEVVFVNREASEKRLLGARERHEVGHNTVQVAWQGVVDPNVNVQALLL